MKRIMAGIIKKGGFVMKIRWSLFLVAFLLVAVMAFTFTGCASDEGGSDETTTSNDDAGDDGSDGDAGDDGSDGDGGNGDSDGSGGASSATYLFYSDENGDIYAVDPENLMSRQLVDSGITTDEEVGNYYAGTYNSANNTISDWHKRYVLYFKDGRIYKVSALKSDSLTPIQVSSEIGAIDLCDSRGNEDVANIDNSVFIYTISGTDGECDTSDDIVKMGTLGMSSTDAPKILNVTASYYERFIRSIYNMSDLSIAGFLMINLNSDLVECDTGFSNCITVKTSVSEIWSRYYVPNSNIIIVEIDEDIYTYDWTTNTLTSIYVSFSGSYISDGSAMYFEDGSKIFRINYNDFSVTELVDEGTNDIVGIALTNNKVVYKVGSPLGPASVMKVVPKAGGAATTIMTVESGESINYVYATADSHIYYTRGKALGHIKDDGSGLSEINARYAGRIRFTTTLRLYHDFPDRILRLEGCADDGDCAGATLKSFDAATYSNELILGTLPDDINNIDIESGHGNPLLGGWWRSSSKFTDDIFFVDVTKSNSLQRITNSPSLDERVIH